MHYISAEYIVFSMVLTTLCLLSSLGVLNVHHHHPGAPLPPWVCRLLLHGLARALFASRPELCRCKTHPSSQPPSPKVCKNDLELIDVDDHAVIGKKSARDSNHLALLPPNVLQYINKKLADDEQADKRALNKDQWEHAAKVIDRFLLVLSFCGITIMSLTYTLVIIGV